MPIIPDYLLGLEEEQEARDLFGFLWNNSHINLTHFNDFLFNLTFSDLNHTFQGRATLFHGRDTVHKDTQRTKFSMRPVFPTKCGLLVQNWWKVHLSFRHPVCTWASHQWKQQGRMALFIQGDRTTSGKPRGWLCNQQVCVICALEPAELRQIAREPPLQPQRSRQQMVGKCLDNFAGRQCCSLKILPSGWGPQRWGISSNGRALA